MEKHPSQRLNLITLARHVYNYSQLGRAREWVRARGRPNAVFIWIPKTAGTSLWRLLDAPKLKEVHLVKHQFVQRGVVTFGHMDYSQLVEQGFVSRTFDDSSYKFAIVRNPYDRTASLMSYLKHIKVLPKEETFLNFCRRLERHEYPSIGLFNYKGMSQCNPQTRWVENTSLDFIGRMENLTESLREIAPRIGVRLSAIPHENKSSRKSTADYYDQETKDIVDHVFDEDFSNFGYEKVLQTS